MHMKKIFRRAKRQTKLPPPCPLVIIEQGKVSKATHGGPGFFFEWGTPPFNYLPD
jgi:hypothetical protein